MKWFYEILYPSTAFGEQFLLRRSCKNTHMLSQNLPSIRPLKRMGCAISSLPAIVKPRGPFSCLIISTMNTAVLPLSLQWLLSLSLALLLGLSVWWPESSPLWTTALVSILLKLCKVNLALCLWMLDQSSVRSRFRIFKVIISSGEFWRILKAVSCGSYLVIIIWNFLHLFFVITSYSWQI